MAGVVARFSDRGVHAAIWRDFPVAVAAVAVEDAVMRGDPTNYGEAAVNECSAVADGVLQQIAPGTACESQVLDLIGAPYRIRTGVTALRGPCPGPLDEGSVYCGGSSFRAR